MKTITVVYSGTNGDIEAHRIGCKDIARVCRRNGSSSEDFTYEDEAHLCRQISTAIVGNLESAIAETGNPNGGWYVEDWKPCTKRR